MSGFADRRESKVGSFGAEILDAKIRKTGGIPYKPDADAPHPFDRLVASPDKRSLCIVEVKTKCRREFYPDTGIDRRHYDDYRQITTRYAIPLWLAFVDAKEGRIYGNTWTELVKPREVRGLRYPWEQWGIVYFPLAAMQTLAALSAGECAVLLALRRTQWEPPIEIVHDAKK